MAEQTLWTVALVALGLAAAGVLAVRVHLAPAVGYLLVGVLFAPRTFGYHVVPEPLVEGLAEVGVLFLLFLIGLELDLKRLREALQSTAWTMSFSIAVTTAVVAVVARLLGWSFAQAVTAGIAVAVSSTLFGEALTRGRAVPNEARRRVLGVLIAEDFAAGVLLALIVVLSGSGGAGGGGAAGWLQAGYGVGRLLFLMLLLMGAALLLVPRILDAVARRHVHELVVLWAVGLVVLFGYLGYKAGSAELGALVAGVAAAEAGSRYVVRNSLAGIRDIALAVFFFVSGLAADVWGGLGHWEWVLLIAGASLLAKLAVHIPAAIAAGQELRPALQTGVALGTIGEFTLILVAVADKQGLAHPGLHDVVVGAMVLLLPVAGLMMLATTPVARAYWRIPPRVRRPLGWVVHSLRRSSHGPRPDEHMRSSRRKAVRMLLSNGILLAAWGLVAAALAQRYMVEFTAWQPFWGPTLFYGAVLGIAVPLARGAYRAYRQVVWLLVGLRAGERAGAGRVRSRIVDAWVTATAFLALVFVAVRLPQTLPVVVGAGLVALIVATVAWSQLARFHNALEGTLSRVLGEEAEAGALLDMVLQRYPWGVRFAAVPVPTASPVANHTVQSSRIAELTGSMVAVLQRRQEEIVNPKPEERILAGDILVLIGDAHQLSRAEALIVSHGEALRLEAQSRSAIIEELRVEEASEWAGRTLGETGIRERTGTLVLGVWKVGGTHPMPYHPYIRLAPNDRLILLGTPLQMARARQLAAGAAEETAG